MKFLVKFTVTKRGFFSNETVDGSEVIESTSLENAYIEQTERVKDLVAGYGSDAHITVNEIIKI